MLLSFGNMDNNEQFGKRGGVSDSSLAASFCPLQFRLHGMFSMGTVTQETGGGGFGS